jgi:hypothetical protein
MLKPNKLAITYQKQNELISQKNYAGHCTNVRGPQRASRQIVHNLDDAALAESIPQPIDE